MSGRRRFYERRARGVQVTVMSAPSLAWSIRGPFVFADDGSGRQLVGWGLSPLSYVLEVAVAADTLEAAPVVSL